MEKKSIQSMGWPVFGPGHRNNGTVSSAGGAGTHEKDRKSLRTGARSKTRSGLRAQEGIQAVPVRGPGVPRRP